MKSGLPFFCDKSLSFLLSLYLFLSFRLWYLITCLNSCETRVMDMMVVVLVLALTQAKLSGGNVNYNSEGWNESPAILDNNPEFLLALRGGRKKKISPCVTIPLARAHKRERKHFTMRRTGDVFSTFSFPLDSFFTSFFFIYFFLRSCTCRAIKQSEARREERKRRERRKPWRVANFSICLLQLCE